MALHKFTNLIFFAINIIICLAFPSKDTQSRFQSSRSISINPFIVSTSCNHVHAPSLTISSKLISTSTKLFGFNDNNDIMGDSEEEELRTRVRLKEEVASPFRKLRFFIYLAIISGGGLGFVTTLPQLIFAIQDNNIKGNLMTTLSNTGIDFAGVIGGILLWIREAKDEGEKLDRFTIAEKKLTNSLSSTQKSSRESKLSKLPIEIQFSLTDENATKIVSFSELQEKGKQNIVILAGCEKFIRDAMISARIEGNDFFNNENIILVPVMLSQGQDNEQMIFSEDKKEGSGSSSVAKGFGTVSSSGSSKEAIMTAPYIAKPAQVSVWQRDLEEEVSAAKKQGATDIISQGLVLVVKKTGKVVRRGVGIPIWKKLTEDLKQSSSASAAAAITANK